MNILLVEDDTRKRDEIVALILSLGIDRSQIRIAANMVEFVAQFDATVGICVVDLRLAGFDGGDVEQTGLGI